MKKHTVLIALVLIFSAAFLVSCASTGEEKSHVSLSGRGVVILSPDMAEFSVGVSETADTTAEALRLANTKMNAVLDIIRAAGVSDKDIETGYMNLNPSYSWVDGERVLLGQNASQNVHVTVRDLGDNNSVIAKVIDRLASVDGIELGSVSFDASDKGAAYSAARQAAIEDALIKAGDYAAAAGLKLGKVSAISEGYDPSYRNAVMMNMSDGVMYEATAASSASGTSILSGDIEVSISVNVSVELI